MSPDHISWNHQSSLYLCRVLVLSRLSFGTRKGTHTDRRTEITSCNCTLFTNAARSTAAATGMRRSFSCLPIELKSELLDTVKATKLAYCGHTTRKQGSYLEKEIMQGRDARCTQARKATHGLDGNIKTWTGLPV